MSHPSGFIPLIVHTDDNGVKTMVIDKLNDDDVSDAKGLASATEWQLRQKDGDYLGEYTAEGKVDWSLNEDPSTGERWLKVQLDPR
ncbi:hypothetical protein KNLIENLN_00074 [Sinorhizobium phage NV1.1.1]|nr:hypothetical protein KNLIENLN_00074 [Sinorhizobium phage NV1.1.1]